MTEIPEPIERRELSTRPILVIGNSHTSAIATAVKIDDIKNFDVVNIATFFDPALGPKKLHGAIADYFQPEHIFCTFGGSEHNVFGLLDAPEPFDFVTPFDDSFDRSRRYVPFALIRGALERARYQALRNLEALLKIYNRPVIQICTPPPFRELDSSAVLPPVFQSRPDAAIAPANIRHKLHYTHSEILRQQGEKLGVGFLTPPSEATDSDGYLKREYWKTEPTHGNVRYGRLVVKQIQEAVLV